MPCGETGDMTAPTPDNDKTEEITDREASGTTAGPPARWREVVREAGWLAWNRIGLVMSISLTFAACLAVPLGLSRLLSRILAPAPNVALTLALLSALAGLALTGACHAAMRLCAHLDTNYADFWDGVRRLGKPGLRLGLLDGIISGVIGLNIGFYTRLHTLAGIGGRVFCAYVALFALMMAIYHFPLLVAQETGVFDEPGRTARRGAFAVFRRAFYLALGSPFFSLALALTCLGATGLLLLTMALPALLWLGVFALLTTAATRSLLIQFGILPSRVEEDIVPDEKFRIALEERRQD